MVLFNLYKDNKLSQIDEVSFNLEKDIQKIVENNIQSLFSLEFVVSEFFLDGLRIDTLGFDNESRSFVIIEYKKDRNFTVIDQGYAYLALLLSNKADFVLLYNENRNKLIRKNDIDWSQLRIIFISPNFTNYQRKAIEFKELPIELWEIKRYTTNIVSLNQIQTPKKGGSIMDLNQKTEAMKRVSKEVKVYDEEAILLQTTEKLQTVYKELKESIFSIGTDIEVKPKAKYVAFVRKSNFLEVTFFKSSLKLYLNIKGDQLNDPKKISRDVSNIGHWGSGNYEVILKESKDIGYLLSLIRQAYDQN
jgi:predicted transport protein